MLPQAPQNDMFYNAFSKTIAEIAKRWSPHDIADENWKLIGDYPSIMDDIIQRCRGTYKNSSYVEKFYEVNPHLVGNKELARHLLLQLEDDRAVEHILRLHPEHKAYFFEDIEKVAQWLKRNPMLLDNPAFDGLRTNAQLFELMQDSDKLMLKYFHLPCPDKPERIEAWLNFSPLNYKHLPHQYKVKGDVALKVLSAANDNLKLSIYTDMPPEVQKLPSITMTMVQAGHYNDVVNKNEPDTFRQLCQYNVVRNEKLKVERKHKSGVLALDCFKDIDESMLKNRHNVQALLESVGNAEFFGDAHENYQIWLPILKALKKHDPFIGSIIHDINPEGHPKWHMGLNLKEAKKWSTLSIQDYFKKQVGELAQQYEVYNNAQDLRENLTPSEHGKKSRMKI